MFLDIAKINIKSGKGGDGCISFRQEKYVEMGGPNGGNGGKGGDVYLIATNSYSTLYDFTRNRHFLAEDGFRGTGGLKTGRQGEDLYIKVPIGTQVYIYDEKTQAKTLKADLVNDGDSVKVANGGKAGRGNASFKTQNRTAPRIAEKGQPAEEVIVILELKLIAKIGLLGYPNAGKSTLLSVITRAKPKIADYPFTTLNPNLGVIEYYDEKFVVADIPGIIDGAHNGIGLGFDFLRHVERTKILVHLLDVNGYGDKNIYENFMDTNNELFLYNVNLIKKRQIVLITKKDTFLEEDKEARKNLDKLKKKIKNNKKCNVLNIFEISSLSREGLQEFLDYLYTFMKEIKDEKEEVFEDKKYSVKEYTLEPDFKIEKEDDVFYVRGKKIETLVSMTFFSEPESLMRFQNILNKMGIDKALIEYGVQKGDLVKIGHFEFYFER